MRVMWIPDDDLKRLLGGILVFEDDERAGCRCSVSAHPGAEAEAARVRCSSAPPAMEERHEDRKDRTSVQDALRLVFAVAEFQACGRSILAQGVGAWIVQRSELSRGPPQPAIAV
jgi:hypothetical protein